MATRPKAHSTNWPTFAPPQWPDFTPPLTGWTGLDRITHLDCHPTAPDGPFWNEAPDRVSDLLIFVGLGYGVDLPELGWAAAALAIGAAYVRELGRASTGENDFCGPMAKPHRMALITGAGGLACFEGLWGGMPAVLPIALWVIAIGTAGTIVRRSARMIARMNDA